MDTIQLSLLIAFAVAAVAQIFYYSFFMFRIIPKSQAETAGRRMPLSVIICAKNEGANLRRNIPLMMAQKYPEFQVIVVNDCSEDDTDMALAELKQKYPQLYYTSIPVDSKFHHGKKLAVVIGIKAARYEHMVFVDADCAPVSENYLATIAGRYADGRQMVLGYGRYARRPGFVNTFIRYETFWNAVQYFGFALAVRPFMGVGRNISYTRTLYEQSSKYRGNLSIVSGDDDMFVSDVGTRANTAVCFSPDGQTESEPKRTWAQWITQKSRHLSTAPLYGFGVKFFLLLETISRLLFWTLFVFLLILGSEMTLQIAAVLFLIRILLMYLSIGMSARKMGEGYLWAWALPMDLLMPAMQSLAWARNIIYRKSDVWD